MKRLFALLLILLALRCPAQPFVFRQPTIAGCVAHWKLDEPGYVTNFLDCVGANNLVLDHGVGIGTATNYAAPGILGLAFTVTNVNGVWSQFVRRPYPGNQFGLCSILGSATTTNFTITGWVKFYNVTQNSYIAGDWSGAYGCFIRFNNTSTIDWTVYPANWRVTPSFAPVTNVWYHLACVLRSPELGNAAQGLPGGITLYINGALIQNATSPMMPANNFGLQNLDTGNLNVFEIGNRPDAQGSSYIMADDFNVFNRPLSSDEVKQDYNGGFGNNH